MISVYGKFQIVSLTHCRCTLVIDAVWCVMSYSSMVCVSWPDVLYVSVWRSLTSPEATLRSVDTGLRWRGKIHWKLMFVWMFFHQNNDATSWRMMSLRNWQLAFLQKTNSMESDIKNTGKRYELMTSSIISPRRGFIWNILFEERSLFKKSHLKPK